MHKKMLNDSRSQLQIQANTGKYKQIQAGKTERKCDKEGTVITREEINGGGGAKWHKRICRCKSDRQKYKCKYKYKYKYKFIYKYHCK